VTAPASTVSFDTIRAHEPPAILAKGLGKKYARHWALRPIDFSVATGERLAIIGPNGAGKTTLIRVLALLTRASSGALNIGGYDASGDATEIRRLLGVVLHDSMLYPELTAAENLRFACRLYRVGRPAERVARLLEQFELHRLSGTRVRSLSRGQRQRVSIARALVHAPSILLLDEPDTGQDAAAMKLLERTILDENTRTIVFTTHQLGFARALATRVLRLDDGVASWPDPANSLQEPLAPVSIRSRAMP
jgi:ABC-type multidrug transport system ATPase subunit